MVITSLPSARLAVESLYSPTVRRLLLRDRKSLPRERYHSRLRVVVHTEREWNLLGGVTGAEFWINDLPFEIFSRQRRSIIHFGHWRIKPELPMPIYARLIPMRRSSTCPNSRKQN